MNLFEQKSSFPFLLRKESCPDLSQISCTQNHEMTYRRVPKVTTLVTFGFRTPPPAIASFGGSLFSGARYFRMAKKRTPHGHFKRQKSKKCERNTF